MNRISRFLVVGALSSGAIVMSAFAWAYWTQSGTGAAGVSVVTLAAPANVTATVAGGSAVVQVSWPGVVGPDGGNVDGYYVQRYSGTAPSAACSSSPTVLLPSASTSCSDPSVTNGAYTYRVTAVFHSWTAVSPPSAAVTVDALEHFAVTAPPSVTAG